MQVRAAGTIVYVAGSTTSMFVVHPDTYRDWHDRTRRNQIKLRPEAEPAARGRWYRSDQVTG